MWLSLDHPGAADVIAAGPATYTDAIAACLATPTAGITVVYQKQMAHHLLDDTDKTWIDELRNCLLLRDPRRVLASYTRVREKVTLHDIGLPQQLDLLDRCELVIDSDDFLTDPGGYLREVCNRFGVDDAPSMIESMLSWPPGSRASDGVWAPHWYSAVEASTGFGPAPTGPPPEVPEHLREVAVEALDIYETLRARRLTPDALR